MSFVGSTCTSAAAQESLIDGPSEAAVEFASAAMRSREKDLMSRPGVIGVGIGQADDNSQEAAIVVYIDSTAQVKTALPKTISGIQVKRIYSEPFVAY